MSKNHADEPLPTLIVVVDQDLRVQELNGAAARFLGPGSSRARHRRKGEAFDCVHHREAPDGCGHGRFCQICPIREAAVLAYREQRLVRRRTRAEIGRPGEAHEAHLLVTATPLPPKGSPRILLVLEDITALVDLQKPIPICASCRRIRGDAPYWEQMETHFRQHFDVDLSHGLCPECQQQLYGGLVKHPASSRPQRRSSRVKR